MNRKSELNSLLHHLWLDLQDPNVIWQVAVLLSCLAVAFWRSRAALARLREEPAGAAAAAPGPAARARPTIDLLSNRHAREAAIRMLFPFYGLVLVLLARFVLARWHHTHLLQTVAWLLGAMALARLAVYAVSRLARTPTLVAFERVLVVLVWSGMALYLTGLWVDLVDVLESLVIPVGKQRVSLWTVLNSGFWVLMTMLAALWVGGFIESRLLASQALDAGLRTVLGRLTRGLLILIGALLGLSLVGLDLTALSVFGGALGVGIGLGLQRIASNYISGFIVLLERMVKIGDMVKVDQFSGQVKEIRTRFTVVRGLDGIDHIIPNEVLTGQVVQNFSTAGALRLKVEVQVAYGTDLALATRLAVQAAQSVPRVLRDAPVVVMLSQFAADGLGLDVGFAIADPHNGSGNVRAEVAAAIWARFSEAGISVPFPQREVRLIDAGASVGGPPKQAAGPESSTVKGAGG